VGCEYWLYCEALGGWGDEGEWYALAAEACWEGDRRSSW
jgi:hypothetical protein